TGSTHGWRAKRVTNDRAATSRARLYDGHEAPVGSRPRTCAGCFTIQRSGATRANRFQVHGPSGVACDAGGLWPLKSTGARCTGEVFPPAKGFFRTAGDRGAPGYAAGFSIWRQHEAAPNPYPRVGQRAVQRSPSTVGGELPRPRNSCVPPRRPFKTMGSRHGAVPVRLWLGGRATSGGTIPSSRQGFNAGPGRRGVIQAAESRNVAEARLPGSSGPGSVRAPGSRP